MATIILGAQWGDEGKGKLTDILCQKVKVCSTEVGECDEQWLTRRQLCARSCGGNNAGCVSMSSIGLQKINDS